MLAFDDSLMSKSQKSRSMSEGTGLVVVTTGGWGGSGLMFDEETSGELSSPAAEDARLAGA